MTRGAAGHAAARVAGAAARLILLIAAIAGSPRGAAAQEMDPSAAAVSDTVFAVEKQPGPSYYTVYDRDRSRSNWTQTLSWFRSTPRFAFNGNGSTTTQDLLNTPNKGTFGDFFGHLDARLTRRWVVSVDGRYGMNSTVDATRNSERRDNRLQVRTQYNLNPVPSMFLTGALYTEFQQDHERSTQRLLFNADPEDSATVVDTLKVQQDSSFTSARQDGLSALATWRMKSWLEFYGSAAASRRKPSQTSEFRDFVNPLDGSGGGTAARRLQTTHEPSDNAVYTSRLTFSRIPRSKLILGLQSSSLDQSRFDQQLRGQEQLQFDRTAGTMHLEYGPLRKAYFVMDASLVRSLQDYKLRRNSNSLVTTRQLSSTLSYSDPITSGGLTLQLSRAKNERQVTQNGNIINRGLLGNGYRRLSRRLTLDGSGSLTLQSSRYVNARADQDILRSAGSVGGGYLLTPSCSTIVHLTLNRSKNVSLDPVASSANNVQTTYQINASVLFVPNRNFSIRQYYLASAEYKIFDYTERQNYLSRVRRVDTDFVDSIFSFAFVRLTHSFIYRDNGGYSRNSPAEPRTFRIGTETYDQTLSATCGLEITPGVKLVGTQSLLNQRTYDVVRRTSTLRNRFSLNLGLDVARTLRGGAQIVGALRHIGGYDERITAQTPAREEDYWITGVTFQKDF